MNAQRTRGGEVAAPAASAGSVLLESPSLSDGAVEACPALHDRPDRNLLLVSLAGDTERRLDAWRRHGGVPGKVAVVTAGWTRGAAATVGTPPESVEVSTTSVSGPGDLTGIGIKMDQCLSAWADDAAPTEVCFDSITTLLQYVDVEAAFRFLHVTSKRIESADADAHYHLDPGAHDERVLTTVRGLFSERFTYDPDADAWDEG